ncbi:hypothetical protein BUALT_Bualt14G0093500 [Buddleja alternifolia]|uniref:Transcription repressor n=1 Tax=Buddleja alternifolia TaxID=168488 RepID=A0AAV6WGF5_9LAMI|nr:hypothetical protein BUALT_Bualt14G0093500 [Buddleja alternifolia]
MSNILWKSFNLCVSKFKCLPLITVSPPITLHEEDEDQIFPITTNIPSSHFKNFNSLYDVNYSDTISTTTTAAAADESFFATSSDSDIDSVPDFSSAFASHRFFFSSPGRSNSIIEKPPGPPPPQDSGEVVSGGVAVQTYSPDPYVDFRQSMQEMIEAREMKGVKDDDWEFLHELLLCYLTLNPKHTHKYILGAFADVIVTVVWPPTAEESCRKSHYRRRSDTSKLSN